MSNNPTVIPTDNVGPITSNACVSPLIERQHQITLILQKYRQDLQNYTPTPTPKRYKPIDKKVLVEHPELVRKAVARYVSPPVPPVLTFPDNPTAETYLTMLKDEYIMAKAASNNTNTIKEWLTVTEAVEVFIQSKLAATVMRFDGRGDGALVVYDYDIGLYTFSRTSLSRWLTCLRGSASDSDLKTFIQTLESVHDRLEPYRPLPRWMVAVGNGIYNTITRTLEPHTPYWTITSKIETDYYPDAPQPAYLQGMTFESMVADLANNNSERVELILQMCKTIVLGYASTPAIFIMLGAGGDGKSTFMELMSNVVGSYNVGALSFDDMNDDSKVVEVVQKRLIVGMDNDDNSVIKNTKILKSAASREVVSLFRKHLTAVNLRFTGIVVELCNQIPRIESGGSAMRRRLVAVHCERSHYERGEEIVDFQEIIKDRRFHEYVLSRLLDDERTPYFTDFNAVDRHVINRALDDEDPVGMFFLEMLEQGFFGGGFVPRSVLYGMYLDWLARKHPKAMAWGAKRFERAILPLLERVGFGVGGDGAVPLVACRELYGFEPAVWAGLYGGFACTRAVLDEAGYTELFVRVRSVGVDGVVLGRDGERLSVPCDVFEYFNLWEELAVVLCEGSGLFEDVFVGEGLGGLLVPLGSVAGGGVVGGVVGGGVDVGGLMSFMGGERVVGGVAAGVVGGGVVCGLGREVVESVGGGRRVGVVDAIGCVDDVRVFLGGLVVLDAVACRRVDACVAFLSEDVGFVGRRHLLPDRLDGYGVKVGVLCRLLGVVSPLNPTNDTKVIF